MVAWTAKRMCWAVNVTGHWPRCGIIALETVKWLTNGSRRTVAVSVS